MGGKSRKTGKVSKLLIEQLAALRKKNLSTEEISTKNKRNELGTIYSLTNRDRK